MLMGNSRALRRQFCRKWRGDLIFPMQLYPSGVITLQVRALVDEAIVYFPDLIENELYFFVINHFLTSDVLQYEEDTIG